MRSYDLFEESGKLSVETIQVSELAKPSHRAFMPYIAAVLSLAMLAAGVWSVVKIVQARTFSGQMAPALTSPVPGKSGDSLDNGYAYTDAIPPAMAPVPAFGLAPLDSKTAKLLSEDVIFTQDTTHHGKVYGLYNVEMRYTVELTDKTIFVLPSTVMRTGYEAEGSTTVTLTDELTEIYVNGIKVDFRARKHHNAAVYQRMFEAEDLQSVLIFPEYASSETKRQMDDTYELLIEAWKEPTRRPEWWYDPEMPELTEIEESRSEHVDMNTFTIEEPGTYTIEIKIVAIGDSSIDDLPNHMIQWIDSPRSMWSEVGERNLTIVIDDEEYPNRVEDGICDIEVPKKEQ